MIRHCFDAFKNIHTCSLKSEDAFTYPQSQYMMSTSQYKNLIRHLTKSMNSRGPSEISDFQSTFYLGKVDFPCMKNGQELLECFQKHSRLVRWSREMVLHTHKVIIWRLWVNIRSLSVSLQNQWIQEDRQKFLTFNQLFALEKWSFLP